MPPLPSVASADRAGRPYSHEYYVLHVIMITMMVIAVLFTRAGAERDRVNATTSPLHVYNAARCARESGVLKFYYSKCTFMWFIQFFIAVEH